MDRYGATSDDPRIDPTFSLEGYADPARIIGPIRAITTIPTVVTGPFSIGADTGCANALFRVTGGIHATTVLGIGICPPNSTAGNAWINNQLVVGTDTGGTDSLRVGGGIRSEGAVECFRSISGATNPRSLHIKNTSGDVYIGVEGSTAGGFFTGSAAYATVLYSTGQPIYFIGPSTVVLDSGIFKPASAGGITLGTAAVPWGITTISSSGALVTDLATLRIRADHSIKEQLLFEDSNAAPLATWRIGTGAGDGVDGIGFYNHTASARR